MSKPTSLPGALDRSNLLRSPGRGQYLSMRMLPTKPVRRTFAAKWVLLEN